MSKRVTISLSDEMYRRLERARKSARTDRSSFVQDALQRQLDSDRHAERVAEYVRGYTEMPETEEELAFMVAAARETFRALDVDEA